MAERIGPTLCVCGYVQAWSSPEGLKLGVPGQAGKGVKCDMSGDNRLECRAREVNLGHLHRPPRLDRHVGRVALESR